MPTIPAEVFDTKFKILSQLSLTEATQLVFRRMLGKTSNNGIPFDEFVAADTFRYVLEQGGSCKRFNEVSQILLPSYGERQPTIFNLRRKTTDFHVFNQVFRHQEYQSVLELCNEKNLNGALNIIDAGSNVGCSPIWWLCHFPRARVVAIEPESCNYAQMQQNIALNHCGDQIIPLKQALWSSNEKLYINQDFRDGREYAFSVGNKMAGSIKQEVLGIMIQEIRSQYNMRQIDILKIDIEGAEKYLLEDFALARETLLDVKILALEIHDDVVDRQKIESNLKQLGYRFTSASETLFAYFP